MGALVGSLAMALLAVVQSSLMTRLTFLEGALDLILLACVSWALTGRITEALVWGFVGGLALDLFSATPLGVSSLGLLLAVWLASMTEGRFWEGHPLAPLGVVTVTSLAFHGVRLAGVWITGHPIDPSLALYNVVLPATFLNVLLSIPAAQLAERTRQAVYPPPVRMG
jgi:rod shape-determining protein MreD